MTMKLPKYSYRIIIIIMAEKEDGIIWVFGIDKRWVGIPKQYRVQVHMYYEYEVVERHAQLSYHL